MMRRKATSGTPTRGSSSSSDSGGLPLAPSSLSHNSNKHRSHQQQQQHQQPSSSSFSWTTSLSLVSVLTVASLWYLYALVHAQLQTSLLDTRLKKAEQHTIHLPFLQKQNQRNTQNDLLQPLPSPDDSENAPAIPTAFDAVYERSQQHAQQCQSLDHNATTQFDNRTSISFHNDSLATLPVFGFIHDYQLFLKQQQTDNNNPAAADPHFSDNNHDSPIKNPMMNNNNWNCQLPPETECAQHHLSIIFMAYNPDRLDKLLKQITIFLTDSHWKTLVAEIILVWNGERLVGETPKGQELLEFTHTHPLRVVYPLQQGFGNDLLNRYHPDIVQVTTKAILYYDDDGPFYSFAAVQAGFELWKRHPRAQVGAMARELTLGKRQRPIHAQLLHDSAHQNDRAFVPHCPNLGDAVDYNYRYFANYDANMVLPSGSILHSNYLCFLWHPLLAPIRRFVRKHPVHPDDITVSTVVSQLAGRAPRVYSRRLNPPSADERKVMEEYYAAKKENQPQQRRRRLTEDEELFATLSNTNNNHTIILSTDERLRHRRLMFGIDWDAKGGMDHNKQLWADLRTEAINALTQYFGSLNSGSIGWCETDSPYYAPKKDGRCQPVMAKIGQLSWMQADGQPKKTCP